MSLSESEFTEIRDRMARNAATNNEMPRSLQERGLVVGDFRVPFTIKPAKKPKYGNVKKSVDGITFDSSAEARRYIELKAMQSAGQIADLELQPRYVLLDKFTDGTGRKHRSVEYRADFRYLDGGGHTVAEDCKGFATEAFKIKFKMAIQKYPHVRFELSR